MQAVVLLYPCPNILACGAFGLKMCLPHSHYIDYEANTFRYTATLHLNKVFVYLLYGGYNDTERD